MFAAFVLLSFGSTFLTPGRSFAAVISLVPEVEVQPDEAAQELSFTAKVRNDGDEAAKDVRIEFPEMDRSFPLVGDLKPGATAEWTGKLSFADLKLKGVGQFVAPYRVLYRDLNYYPFSAAYLAVFDRGEAPGRGTVTSFNGQMAAPIVELGSKTSVAIEIKSIAPTPLTLDDIRIYTGNEIGVQVDGATGVKLAKGETAEYSVRLETAGALVGSSYAAQVVVRGERDGKHFVDITGFQIGIVDSRMSPVMFLALALSFSGALVLWWVFRKIGKRPTY